MGKEGSSEKAPLPRLPVSSCMGTMKRPLISVSLISTLLPTRELPVGGPGAVQVVLLAGIGKLAGLCSHSPKGSLILETSRESSRTLEDAHFVSERAASPSWS